MRFDTRAVHEGEEPDFAKSGDVVMPIHLSSTFARKDVAKPTAGYEYSRTGNPTRDALERKLASLEGAKHALAFSSGLAAETTLALALLNKGDHIVAFDDLYGGTRRLFDKVLSRFGISVSYVDARDIARVAGAMRPETRMVWLETPTNPLLRLCDIRAIAGIARKRGALTVVDNTFASPFFQQPLALGADIALHSTTKYINGHSDSVGGCVMLNDARVHEKLRFHQNAVGAILSPFDSFLVARGAKTLALRMRKHEENALAIARFLEGHRKVRAVHYPGLSSHPQHALAKRQMSGFSGMLSFELSGLKEAKAFLSKVRVFALAESLGGVESLIEHPALMTHASVPESERKKLGISVGLVRISAGIEHADDLLADLERALR